MDNSMSVTTVESLLEQIAAEYQRLPPTKQRRVTIPVIFNRWYDENFISDYLAYILDPQRNGIGVEPLLKLIELAYGSQPDFELEPVEIQREYTFRGGDNGRIDFLIRLGVEDAERQQAVICIENKLGALEGMNQTASYVRGVRQDFRKSEHALYLIFLTPDKRLPSSPYFKPLSYGDLAKALREVRYPVLDDIHKSVIWEDFLAHIEEYIAMDQGKLKLSPKAGLYVEHHAMLEDLQSAYHQDAERVYKHVTARIQETMGVDWVSTFKGHLPYQVINPASWGMGGYHAFYQYFFSCDSLLVKSEFALMLGVYPKNPASRQFMEWFRSAYPQIEAICQQREIEAYPARKPGTLSFLIAYKTYSIDPADVANIAQPFVQAAQEFSVFTPILDEAIALYKRQQGQ